MSTFTALLLLTRVFAVTTAHIIRMSVAIGYCARLCLPVRHVRRLAFFCVIEIGYRGAQGRGQQYRFTFL